MEADDREAREEAMPAQTEFTLSRSVLLPGLTVERASRAAVTTDNRLALLEWSES